jgi:hypothetical protein
MSNLMTEGRPRGERVIGITDGPPVGLVKSKHEKGYRVQDLSEKER